MSKSRRGKSASTNEISKWETELVQIPFSEESWKACVFFVVPNKVEDNAFIDIFSDIVSTGLRKLYSVITYDGLMKDVKEYAKGASTGGGKGKGAAAVKPPPFHEICEQVKLQMDQGEAISASMMAKLLKFKLLHVKQKDFERREEERKAAKAAEAGKKDEKGKKSGSPSGKRSKSPGKKRGKKEADLPPSPKKDTKMRRRGDIEDTFKTIDDEPDDEGSPQHYVLIHGILTSPVIYHLCEIGINIDAIISLKAQSYDRFFPKLEPSAEGELGKEEQGLDAAEGEIQDSEEQAQKREAERHLEAFWSESDSLIARVPSGHKLKDIARYEVVVKDKDVPDGNLQELEADRKTEFGTAIFEDVAVVCYDMLDQLQQYKKYLQSMKLIRVPLHNPQPGAVATAMPSTTDVPSTQSLTTAQAPDAPPAPVPVEVDMRYYNHLMNSIPPQSQSVPLIMNCLLEQVAATVDEKNPLEQEVPPRADGLNHLLASHISNKASRLALSTDEKQAVEEARDDNKSDKQETTPKILHYGDEMTSRLHHVTPLNGLDAYDAELRILQLLPQSQLKNLPELEGREMVERAARANELQHFCLSESVPARTLERALKQYAFEGMLLKLADEDGEIMEPPDVDEAFESYVNAWDYPYNDLGKLQKMKFTFDEGGQLKVEESGDETVLTAFRNLDEWCFAEHFDQKTLVQVLEEARFFRPYSDTYYHKRDHSLLLVLHNPVGPRVQSSSSWQSKLHSNVGFRNYLEHVVDSIKDWVQEEERLRIEATRTPTPPPPVLEQPTIPLKVGSRYGLMTRAEVTAIKAEEEEKNKKGKGRKSARSRTPKRSAKSREKSESPEKKEKEKKREGSAVSRQKSAGRRTPSAKGSLSVRSAASKGGRGTRSRSRLEEPEEPESLPIEEPVEEKYDFIGYDVGDSLIHACGSLRTMFPCDGGQIRVDKTCFVQGSRSVRTSVYKDGNIFLLHFLEPLDGILKKEDMEGEAEEEEEEKAEEKCPVVDTEGDAEGIEKSELEESEKEEKEVKPKKKGPKPFCDFSSITAQLSDGMIVSLSGYGPSGSIKQMEPKEGEELILGQGAVEGSPPTQATPSPQPKAGSPKARKRTDEEVKRLEELQQQHEEQQARQEEEAKRKAEEERLRKPFQQFFLTCPDGLHVEFLNDGSYQTSGDQGGVLVRQSYPVKASGPRECDVARLRPAMEETSRTVMTDGTVIKLLVDGSLQVLFPDGAVSRCQSLPSKSKLPSSPPGSAVARAPGQDPAGGPTKKGTRAPAKGEEPAMPTITLPDKVPEWLSTGVDGERVLTRPDGSHETLSNVLCSVASDPQSGQVVKTREDNVVTVERPDGTQIVEHADGTRITTLYKQVEREIQPADNETGEQAQVSSVLTKFVKVECTGFATLVFDSESGSCESVFGNGTIMSTQANGASRMRRADESMIQIDAKGVVYYIPPSIANTNIEPAADDVAAPAGVYVMRSASQQCCEMIDSRGTRFSVISNGQISVEKAENQDPHQENTADKNKNWTSTAASEPTNTIEQTATAGPLTQAPLTTLVPRFFIVHADGSGTELLRPCDVTDFLAQAEKDPGTAVLRSPVEGHPDATGITVLRPYSGGTGKIWLKEKDEASIVPGGLRERDFSNVPAREEKKTGPAFGTNVGSGLNVGSVFKPSLSQPLITCPKVLEFRQLIQYRPLTSTQRQQLSKAVEAYGKYVAQREGTSDALLPEDPREESQKIAAEELRAKMKDREEALNKSAVDTITLQSDEISQKYVEAITPEPVPPPPAPTWKRPASEWERDRLELAELEYGKHSLRHHGVPAYFESTQGQNFLRGLYSKKVPDMDALTSELARNTRHPPPGDGSPVDTPELAVLRDSSMSDGGDDKEKASEVPTEQNATTTNYMLSPTAHASSESPNDVRPTNPTPGHATGDGTPTPVRPTNPTPAHASKTVPTNSRPSNPTPKHAAENEPNESPSYEEASGWRNNLPSVQEVVVPETPREEPVTEPVFPPVQPDDPDDDAVPLCFSSDDEKFGARSLYFDVTGELRKDPVQLPVSILSSKPGALVNSQFMEVEDPVRRRVHTVSVTGGDPVSQNRVENLRGFELLPAEVSFGVLKEGCTYLHSVLLKNVGIDSCRFKVKQPPPSTGLRVLYTPGPVAAGMSTCLDVEIFAVAVGVVGESGLGHVGHHVEIVTETDVLYLPVHATVMTSYEYESRHGDEDGGMSTNTRRVPNRPPSRDPTRPRKEEHFALLESSN